MFKSTRVKGIVTSLDVSATETCCLAGTETHSEGVGVSAYWRHWRKSRARSALTVVLMLCISTWQINTRHGHGRKLGKLSTALGT